MVSGPDDLAAALEAVGRTSDSDINLGEAALTLAGLAHPGLSLDRYRNHVRKLTEDVRARHAVLIAAGAADDLATQLAALKHVLADVNEYIGDSETYDDLQNADLIRVIDRRKGMPITLSILYITVARLCGWAAAGLNVPGHFVVRLDRDGQRLIFDPFSGCGLMQASDLRRLVKQSLGEQAELSASYFEPATNRQILIRLQNNIKLRQVEAEDYEGALSIVRTMQAIDPAEFRLLLDAGVLCARTGRPQAAIDSLEAYIRQAPQDKDRHDAALLLQHIRQTMN